MGGRGQEQIEQCVHRWRFLCSTCHDIAGPNPNNSRRGWRVDKIETSSTKSTETRLEQDCGDGKRLCVLE